MKQVATLIFDTKHAGCTFLRNAILVYRRDSGHLSATCNRTEPTRWRAARARPHPILPLSPPPIGKTIDGSLTPLAWVWRSICFVTLLSLYVSGGSEEKATAAGVIAVPRVGALRGGAVYAAGGRRAHRAQPARPAADPHRCELRFYSYAHVAYNSHSHSPH